MTIILTASESFNERFLAEEAESLAALKQKKLYRTKFGFHNTISP